MAWPTKPDFVDGDVLNASQMNNIGTNLNLADPTGITDGYVLTADGADSMGWEALPTPASYTLLTSGTVTNQTEVLLTSISGTYQDLELFVINPLPVGSNAAMIIDCYTGTTPAAGSYQRSTSNLAATYTTNTLTGADARLRLWGTPNMTTTNPAGNVYRTRYYGYANSQANKYADGIAQTLDSSSVPRTAITAGVVTQTTPAALDRIRIFFSGANITCTYQLFGIK